MPKITEMFAFTMIDDNGDEGLIGAVLDPNYGWTPFVGADMKRVEDLKPYANKIAKMKGRPYNILKFKLDDRVILDK